MRRYDFLIEHDNPIEKRTGKYCLVLDAEAAIKEAVRKKDERIRDLGWLIYRPLKEGEMTRNGDQVLFPDEDATWEEVTDNHRPAPSLLYPAHCVYRRNIADELRERIAELEEKLRLKEEEIESHAWEISPAMAQHKIDTLTATVERMQRLAIEIINCEQERLTAQMSGLETVWEHPNSMTYWKRLISLAESALSGKEAEDAIDVVMKKDPITNETVFIKILRSEDGTFVYQRFRNPNPADAAIDLKIWIEKEGK